MANSTPGDDIVAIEDESVFEEAFAAYSLVVVGTLEPDDRYDLAPKHMVAPLGWSGYFGFACSPEHSTTTNIKRTGEFTVSYPRPDDVVSISLTAEPRDEDDQKPDLDALSTIEAPHVDATFIENSYIFLECELERIIEDLGDNNFVIGEITGQYAHRDVLRDKERDDADIINDNPILAYLHPGRYAEITDSQAFPFPRGFKK